MSWDARKTEITAVLNARTYDSKLYEEIPDNLNIETASTAKSHAVYSLEWIGMTEIKSHITNKYTYHHHVKLEIKYVNIGNDTTVDNVDEFTAVVSAIVALTHFNNFSGERPSLRKKDQKHSIFKFLFIFGQESLC